MDEDCTPLTLALPTVLPGIIVYYRKEGRALGEVTKYLVYNMRKRQEGESPRPEGPLLPPSLAYLVSNLCPRDSGSLVFFFLSVAAAHLLPHSFGPFLIPIPPRTFATFVWYSHYVYLIAWDLPPHYDACIWSLGGDRADEYFNCTQHVAGITDTRFQVRHARSTGLACRRNRSCVHAKVLDIYISGGAVLTTSRAMRVRGGGRGAQKVKVWKRKTLTFWVSG